MIYLYVKTHNKTGLKYFGKTSRKDPYSYFGSGKYWIRHLKKYGYEFSTEIIGKFESEEDCSEFAMKFSIENNIIDSDDWANLRNENGLDGAPIGNILSESVRRKISASLYGRSSPKSKYIMKESGESRSERTRLQIINTRWVNDGLINKRINKNDAIPDGWALGRANLKIKNNKIAEINKSGNNTRGKKIYNNGIKHAYFFEREQPDGWSPGKMEGYQGGTGSHRKGKKLNEGE